MLGKLWSDLTASDRISFLALAVSVGALTIGVISILEDIRHSRLSVVPKIGMEFSDGSDEDITGIQLENVGLGPAQVVSIQLYLNGQLVADMPRDEEWREIIRRIAGVDRPSGLGVLRFKQFHSDFFLPAGEDLPLLFVRTSELTYETLTFLESAGTKLQFGACYCSLYEDDCWSYVSPGLNAQPCESQIAQYLLLDKGPLAEKARELGRRRSTERWDP